MFIAPRGFARKVLVERLLAPEEQDVYRCAFLIVPRSGGAPCALALRFTCRSERSGDVGGNAEL
jgi:hypothetical protein